MARGMKKSEVLRGFDVVIFVYDDQMDRQFFAQRVPATSVEQAIRKAGMKIVNKLRKEKNEGCR